MKKSLKNSDNSEDTTPPVADQEALMQMESDGMDMVPAQSVSLALGSVEGSVDSQDLIIPKLNIVQGVGPLSNDFPGGALVLNRETVIAEMGKAVTLTVLSIKKTYEEILPYDPNGPRPKTYATLEEVMEDGKWVDWRENENPKRTAREVATILVLIEKPEDVDCLSFSKNYLGKDYAMAVWTVRGSAYTNGAKKIFSANSIELANEKDGLLAGKWSLSVERKPINGNPVAVPVMLLIGRNDAEFIEAVKADLG